MVCRVSILVMAVLAACTPAAPFNPLEQPPCTVVYPNGLNSPAICTTAPGSACVGGSSFCTFGAGGYCAQLSTDVFNCGGCGFPCPHGASCTDGTCSCPVGQVDCNGRCVDLSTDPNNCGQCGQECGDGVCSKGVCACDTSPSTVTRCGGSPACVDVASAPTDCGACGNACPMSRAVCNDGSCACPDTEPVLCTVGGTSTCTNLDNDPEHCGACGTACATNGICTGGNCACPAGTTLCGNTCVDLSSDPSNCGSCGSSCSGTCTAGTCEQQQCGYLGQPCCGLTCFDTSTCTNGVTCS